MNPWVLRGTRSKSFWTANYGAFGQKRSKVVGDRIHWMRVRGSAVRVVGGFWMDWAYRLMGRWRGASVNDEDGLQRQVFGADG